MAAILHRLLLYKTFHSYRVFDDGLTWFKINSIRFIIRRVPEAGDSARTEPVLSVKKNDIGFIYGAGVDFGVNPANNMRVGLGYRGVVGLVDISDKNKNVTTDSYYLLDRTNIKTYSGYVGFSILF